MAPQHDKVGFTSLLAIVVLATGAAVVARPDSRPAQDPPVFPVSGEAAKSSAPEQQQPTNAIAAAPAAPTAQESAKAERKFDVYSKVEGEPRIISLVPDGSNVKKDDLICELDSAAIRDALVLQRLVTRRAQAKYKVAKGDFECARLSLKEYVDARYPLERQNLENAVALAQAELDIARELRTCAQPERPEQRDVA